MLWPVFLGCNILTPLTNGGKKLTLRGWRDVNVLYGRILTSVSVCLFECLCVCVCVCVCVDFQ